MGADLYAESGEYIDVLSQDAWRALRAPITEALRNATPEYGPVVDVGAGTGLGTVLAAQAVPEADLIAVEPSPILRAVLLSRLAGAEHLRRRVTVLASDVEGMRLPPRLGGVLAINMIGHLPPQRRRELWVDLRQRLAPGAPLIVNLQPPAEVATIPETTFASVTIGRRSYQGSGTARPSGDEAVTWTMRYRTLDAEGTVERELVVDYQWRVLSPRRLADELTAAGYATSTQEMDVVVATPRN
jgi:SAM-dependent methyltransferase